MRRCDHLCMVEERSREIQIRDRWLVVLTVFVVVTVVAVGLYGLLGGSLAVDAFVLGATALMLGAMLMAKHWDRKARNRVAQSEVRDPGDPS